MNIMKIKVLGSSAELTLPRLENGHIANNPIDKSNDSRDKRLRTSIAIETDQGEHVIFDATADLWEQLQKYDLAETAKFLFITHTDSDRVEGLYKKYTPLLTFALKKHWQNIDKCLVPEFKRKEINKSMINLHDLKIFPFPLYHGSDRDMVCGYRIVDGKGATLVYAPELKNIPGVSKKFFKNADVIILDGRQWDYHNKWHASMKQQLRWVKEFEPKRVFFINIGHETLPHKQLVKEVQNINPQANVLYDGQLITIEGRTFSMEGLIKTREELKDIEDQELLYLHSVVHNWFDRHTKGERINWEAEAVISKHQELVEELQSRGFKHYIEDNLDRETFSSYRRGLDKEIEKMITDDILGGETESVFDDYITVSKSSLDSDRIEVIIKQAEPNEFLEFYVKKAFPNEYQDKIAFIYSELGPSEDYIPLFDLSLQPRKSLDLVVLNKELNNSYEYGQFFKTPKAKLVVDTPDPFFEWVTNHLNAGVLITPLYDGIRMVAGVQKGKAFAWVKDRNKDVIKSMPIIEKTLKSLELNDVIFDGMLTELNVNGIPKSLDSEGEEYFEKALDGKLHYYVHDCLWYNGRDLHNEPLKNRLSFMASALRVGLDDITTVKGSLCSTPEQVDQALTKAMELGTIGVFARELLSKYYLNAETDSWASLGFVDKVLDAGAGAALVDNDKDPKIEDETDPQEGTHESS